MAKTKTVRRITRVFSDLDKKTASLNSKLNNSHEYRDEDHEWGDTLELNNFAKDKGWTYEKLGKPHRIRVTITVLDDDA